MGAIVKHRSFGEGIVTSLKDSLIEIQFGNQVKKFQFPQAFGTFLTTTDADLLKRIDEAKGKAALKATSPVTSIPKPTSVKPAYSTPKASSYGKKTHYDIDSPLVGDRAQSIPISSEEEMYEIVGYMARPGRVNSIEAEVPKDGRDSVFEKMFPGQTYRPIELGDTPSGMPNKLSPQFRINFGNLSNCPSILKNNMGKGNGSCIGRINKSKFVITIVQKYGFRFGDWQDVNSIRSNAEKNGYLEAFNRGYLR